MMMTALRRRIARFLCWIAHWIDVMPAEAPRVWVSNALFDLTRQLTDQVEQLDASGEFKRHTVYAALIKAFPDARKKDLSLAIEQVLQE